MACAVTVVVRTAEKIRNLVSLAPKPGKQDSDTTAAVRALARLVAILLPAHRVGNSAYQSSLVRLQRSRPQTMSKPPRIRDSVSERSAPPVTGDSYLRSAGFDLFISPPGRSGGHGSESRNSLLLRPTSVDGCGDEPPSLQNLVDLEIKYLSTGASELTQSGVADLHVDSIPVFSLHPALLTNLLIRQGFRGDQGVGMSDHGPKCGTRNGSRQVLK